MKRRLYTKHTLAVGTPFLASAFTACLCHLLCNHHPVFIVPCVNECRKAVTSMCSHLKSNLYHLTSCILHLPLLTAKSQPPVLQQPLQRQTLSPLLQNPASCLPLHFLCVFVVICIVLVFAFPAPRSRVPAAMAQIAIAAAMSEPIAAPSDNSRAFHPQSVLFQRLLSGFPPATSARVLPYQFRP